MLNQKTAPARLQEEAPPPVITKEEMNLVEFPFSLPTNRHPKNRDIIHITIEGMDSQQRPIDREWIVTGSRKYGLPLATDEEVLLGLFHLWQRDRFKERSVWFTQYSLFKLLGWAPDMRSYRRLEQAMDRLLGLSIKSHQTFWDNKEKCHVTDGFGLVDSYRLWRRDSKSADHPFLSRVTFSEFLSCVLSSGVKAHLLRAGVVMQPFRTPGSCA